MYYLHQWVLADKLASLSRLPWAGFIDAVHNGAFLHGFFTDKYEADWGWQGDLEPGQPLVSSEDLSLAFKELCHWSGREEMPRRLAKCWAIWQQNFGPSSPPTFEAEYELNQRAKLTWEITTHLDACYNPGLKAKIIRGDRAVLIGRYMPPGAPPSTRKERLEFFEYGWSGQYWENNDAVALGVIFEQVTTHPIIKEAFETRVRLGVELFGNKIKSLPQA